MNELQKLINQFPNKPWNWEFLSKNINITCDIIDNNLDKPWSWEHCMIIFLIITLNLIEN